MFEACLISGCVGCLIGVVACWIYKDKVVKEAQTIAIQAQLDASAAAKKLASIATQGAVVVDDAAKKV